MLSFLRFFGVTVAAVWFGSTVFFTFFAGPAFFTDEMKKLVPPPYNGAIAELVLSRYFILHYICGFLALAHLGADWMYSGKIPTRVTVWLVGGVLGLSLLGGLWLQPKLHQLQHVKYADHYRLADHERPGVSVPVALPRAGDPARRSRAVCLADQQVRPRSKGVALAVDLAGLKRIQLLMSQTLREVEHLTR